MLFSESRSITIGSNQRDHFRTVLITIGLFVYSAGFLTAVKWFDLTVFQFLRLESFVIGLLQGCVLLAMHDHILFRIWIFSFGFTAGCSLSCSARFRWAYHC